MFENELEKFELKMEIIFQKYKLALTDKIKKGKTPYRAIIPISTSGSVALKNVVCAKSYEIISNGGGGYSGGYNPT